MSAKNIVKLAVGGVSLILLLVVLFTSIYTIKEQQQGIVLTFGNPTAIMPPGGPYFKVPFAQKVIKVNTTTRGQAIGYSEEDNTSIANVSTMITSDFNFVNADFFLEWRISDPVKYWFGSSDPVSIIDDIAQSCIRSVVGNTSVDSVMTTGKNEVQAKIKELMIAEIDKYDIGIHVVNITIQDVEPPTVEVVNAFKSVENAKQDMDKAINEATGYKNEQLPKANGDADKILQNAAAQKTARINEATGQVARFNEMFTEYIKNPQVTKLRLFYETIEKIMPGLKVVIDDGTGVDKMLPLETFSNITTSPSTTPQS